MTKWIRFEQGGKTGFGTLEDDTIAVHTGDMFAVAKPTGETLKLSDVQLRTPCDPSKMVCLWNNFHQLAAKKASTQLACRLIDDDASGVDDDDPVGHKFDIARVVRGQQHRLPLIVRLLFDQVAHRRLGRDVEADRRFILE